MVDSIGTDNLLVLLGTPTPESTKLYAMTVNQGDPSWAGPLAGEALGLPVFHITEAQIKDQIDAGVYEAEVGVVDMVLDVEDISAAIREVRLNNGAAD